MTTEEKRLQGLLFALKNNAAFAVNIVIYPSGSGEPIISEIITRDKAIEIFSKK